MTERIASLLRAYDLGEVEEITPLGGGHRNAPHVVRAGGRLLFAKLLVPALSVPVGLAARHAFVEHLVARGVRTPRLVRTREGATWVAGEGRALELYEFVEGHRPGPGHVESAGRLLAELHVAGADFPRSPEVPRHDFGAFRRDLERLDRVENQARTYLPAPEVLERLQSVKARLRESAAALHGADLPCGTIHGDFVPANLVYPDTGSPQATDFDGCGHGPLLLDLAVALVGCGHEAAPALLAGYRPARLLADAEVRVLPAAVTALAAHRLLEANEGPERLATELERWANPLDGRGH